MESLLHINRAEMFVAQGMWDEAKAACDLAYDIATQRGDRLREAEALKFRGIVARERGHREDSVRQLSQALELASDGEDTLLRAEILRELGRTWAHEGTLPEARSAFKEAVVLFRKLNATLDAADVRARLDQLEETAA